MPKFTFNLQAALSQRKAIEQQKMLVVAELERARLALEDRLRNINTRVTEEREELRAQLAGSVANTTTGGGLVDLRGVRFQTNAALTTHVHAQQLVLQLAGVHKRIEKARADLLEATTRRKAVETLRERRYEAWKEEEKRKETAALDDIAGILTSRADEDQYAARP